MFQGNIVTPEILGNMTYGYLGSAANLKLFLDDGGDFAAAGGSFSSFGNAAKGFWGIVTNADQKEDKIAIKKGVDWYEKTH